MTKYVLTGCRTSAWRNARGKGIEVYEILANNHWQYLHTVMPEFDNPSWLTFDHKRQQLYVIYGDGENVTQYRFNRKDGKLTCLQSVSTGPRHPNKELQLERKNNSVCAELSPDQQSLLIANHEAGNIAKLDFDSNDKLQIPQYFIKILGKSSPDYHDKSLSRPHQMVFDCTQNYMFVPNQGRKAGNGIDMIQVYRIDGQEYSLVCSVEMIEGCWPRHICVHPSNRFIYCVNELGCTVTVFAFNQQTGHLTQLQELRTLPDEITQKYDVSEINLHHNGKYLYVSNRVHNSISLFYVLANGQLKFEQYFDCQGKTPRFTTLSPDNLYFYSANEDSDNIVEFRINEDNGYLEPTGIILQNASPTCILFI
ncbi:6-phosphogluconolactonase (cycloisomerase 2 family) [Cricetibacter osteomyelitidis]|uniref:6-phosphogluconolactonase (Cycloisomerase 2 family) n=1 Tax=Cricetibacter osteomyelitidis TaxID=1521931 RepID=A0A4R2TI64_9PAST|nr:beta-propeller fold lactonase family protein [Cricetibacter osteomyelitidis]TCP96918.1 6-phosphogluconolactonase (cycloisomerase 2 family) [Cricetibacter osteomyelitidis]